MADNQEVLSSDYLDERSHCEKRTLLQGPEQYQRVKVVISSSLNKEGITLFIEYFLTGSNTSASSGARDSVSIYC